MTPEELEELEIFKSLTDDELLELTEEDVARLEMLEAKAMQQPQAPKGEVVGAMTMHPNYETMSDAQQQAYGMDWANEAKNSLANIFRGDFDKFQQNLASGLKPVNLGDKQIEFINVTKALNLGTPQEVSAELERLKAEGNKLVPYVESQVGKKTWNKTYSKDGEIAPDDRGLLNTIFPNLSMRTQGDKEAGVFSKGIAGAQDVLSLIPRLATAGVKQFSPEGGDVPFMQEVGRPEAFSTGGERLIDFATSGAGGGLALKTAGKLGGKISQVASVGKKLAQTKVGKALASKPAETLEQAVFDIGANSPARYTTKEALSMGAKEGVRRGAVEGARDVALPSLFTATEEEKYGGGVGNALLDASLGTLAGGVLGGAIGGVRGAMGDKLTPAGQEMLGNLGANKRLLKAVESEPLTSAYSGVNQLEKLGQMKDEIASKIGAKREEVYKAMPRVADPVNMNDLGLDILSRIESSLMGLERNLPVHMSPVLMNEARRVMKNVDNAGSFPQFSKNITTENTRLRKLAENAGDNVEQRQVFEGLRRILNNIESEGLVEDYAIREMQNPISGIPSDISRQVGKMKEARDEFKELYSVFEPLEKALENPSETGAKFLAKRAGERIRPLAKAGVENDLNTINGIRLLAKKYGFNDIPADYLTPSVARAVREASRDGEATRFAEMISKIKPTNKAMVTGATTLARSTPANVAQLKNNRIETPEVQEESIFTPIQMLTKGGSISTGLKRPTYKAGSVKELR